MISLLAMLAAGSDITTLPAARWAEAAALDEASLRLDPMQKMSPTVSDAQKNIPGDKL